MGAKGFGWFVAGLALILVGAALWIGLATHQNCPPPLPCHGFGACLGGPAPVCTTHPAEGMIVFLVLGGIGAVCLLAGALARQSPRTGPGRREEARGEVDREVDPHVA